MVTEKLNPTCMGDGEGEEEGYYTGFDGLYSEGIGFGIGSMDGFSFWNLSKYPLTIFLASSHRLFSD